MKTEIDRLEYPKELFKREEVLKEKRYFKLNWVLEEDQRNYYLVLYNFIEVKKLKDIEKSLKGGK